MICKNEEPVIAQALESLKWADEIVVVDGISTDKTVEIVKKFTDKIFQRPWTNFGEQRNFALEHCGHPWVFYLDADEVCSPELIEWFVKFKAGGQEAVASIVKPSPSVYMGGAPQTDRVDLYEIRRWEHFQGKVYKYGVNNPSHQWRFFRRQDARFIGQVHEYPQVPGTIARLELPIYHFPKADLSLMMDKINRYSSLEAEKLFERGVVHGAPHMFFSGIAEFLKAFFTKQGFRDGTLGFIIAGLDATGFFLQASQALFEKTKRLVKFNKNLELSNGTFSTNAISWDRNFSAEIF